MASAKALEGDWQYTSEQGWDPVKVTVKQMMGDQWMVACMIPKGKMMANMLKMNEPGSFSLLKFQASQKESEQEKNKILEEEFLTFMEKGITNIRKDGKNLIIVAGGDEKVFVEDDIRQRHEEAQKAKMANMKGSGRFG